MISRSMSSSTNPLYLYTTLRFISNLYHAMNRIGRMMNSISTGPSWQEIAPVPSSPPTFDAIAHLAPIVQPPKCLHRNRRPKTSPQSPQDGTTNQHLWSLRPSSTSRSGCVVMSGKCLGVPSSLRHPNPCPCTCRPESLICPLL